MVVASYFQTFAQTAAKAMEALKAEFSGIRSNRISPAFLDKIKIDAYGSQMAMSQLASVGNIDARTLEVRPWDISLINEIEKAMLKSELGITPTNDGKVIRVAFPVLTEERRREYAQLAKRFAEEARVRVRNDRRQAQEDCIMKAFKEKKIAEDEKFRRQQELDQLTNKFVAEVDALLAAKEREILEI